ncbi:MAG: AAA family ATPase [Gaiellaceae bacterium]
MVDRMPGAALPTLVVVGGPPAAGKTWIAGELAAKLGFPLLAKDTLKEVLGEALGTRERPDSQRLGAGVFEVLGLVVRELLRAGVSTIVEGNFSARTHVLDALPPARVVQVHVTAAPEVLRERLLTRDSHRHPVHYDREAAAEIAARAAAGEWEPLALAGDLVLVNTTDDFAIDLGALTDRIRLT